MRFWKIKIFRSNQGKWCVCGVGGWGAHTNRPRQDTCPEQAKELLRLYPVFMSRLRDLPVSKGLPCQSAETDRVTVCFVFLCPVFNKRSQGMQKTRNHDPFKGQNKFPETVSEEAHSRLTRQRL